MFREKREGAGWLWGGNADVGTGTQARVGVRKERKEWFQVVNKSS